MLKKLNIAYFSPTGGTRRTALCLGGFLCPHPNEIDLTLPSPPSLDCKSEDVLLIVAPVFGGRIPLAVLERIKAFSGNGVPAITAVVYGNRAYDDALLELNDCITAQGFHVVASAAFVAQHSISRTVAAGRPDAQDIAEMKVFGEKILDKIMNASEVPVSCVPGNHPYIERKPASATPIVSEACTKCGICVQKCPVAAIPQDNPSTTSTEKCILCMRCTIICPQDARSLPVQLQSALDQKLAPCKAVRNQNQLFL